MKIFRVLSIGTYILKLRKTTSHVIENAVYNNFYAVVV